jgi:dihydroflavonol-4-reductase
VLVAVTGAGGHLGANVVGALVARGATVRAVDVRSGSVIAGLARDGHPVEFVRADVLDAASLAAAFAGVEVVYHLAAKISIAGDPDGSVWRVNVDGVRHVAEAALASGVRRMVHTSSIHAYDGSLCPGGVDEGSPRATSSRLPVYDRSKFAGEEVLRQVIGRGLDAVVVNPTAIIGPVDPEPSRMGRVLRSAFRGRLPAVVEGSFDWVDVRDLAAALLAAADRGGTGENYLVGGHYASVGELARVAASVTGRRGPRFTVPTPLVRLGAEAALRLPSGKAGPLFTPEALHALQNGRPVASDKAQRELGHVPRPLAETMTDLRDYFEGPPAP